MSDVVNCMLIYLIVVTACLVASLWAYYFKVKRTRAARAKKARDSHVLKPAHMSALAQLGYYGTRPPDRAPGEKPRSERPGWHKEPTYHDPFGPGFRWVKDEPEE